MRHSFSPTGPPAPGAGGVLLSPTLAPRVAATRIPQALAAGLPGAIGSTVNLAAVATATDDHLTAASAAQEQPGRDHLVPSVVADAT
jgi:hypothetical protein